jgi:tetratricopeptide (TPR) repeat protein
VFRHPVDLLDERLIDASEAAGGRYDVLAGLDELRRRQLHRLAAAHCERALNDPLEAGWHYLRAGDPAEAAELVATRTADIVASGRSAAAADLVAELLAAGELTGDTERVVLITRGDLLLHTERAGEAEQAYRDALARPAPPVVRAEAAWRLAQSLLQRGKVPEALELCRETACGLTGDEEVLLAQLGVVRSRAHLMLSEFGQATAVAEDACAAAERIADVAPDVAAAVRARGYWVFGVVARLRARPDEATGWLRRAATAARGAGLGEVTGRALFNLAAIALELGEIGQAEQLLADALAEARQAGDGYSIGRILHALGTARVAAGKPDEAIRLFGDAHGLKVRMGDALGAANSEHALALVLLSQGRPGDARVLLAKILSSTEQLGERRARAHYLDSLAMADLVDGDQPSAQRHLADAAAIAAEVDNPSLRAPLGIHRALALLAPGDLAAAAAAAGDCERQVAGADPWLYVAVSIEHAALAACLALASGDRAAAAASAADMASRASKAGDVRYGEAARRISAAIASAAGGAEPPAAFPRLLWVSGGR